MTLWNWTKREETLGIPEPDSVKSENERRFSSPNKSTAKLPTGRAKLTVHAPWSMCVVSFLREKKVEASRPRLGVVRMLERVCSFGEDRRCVSE